MSNVLFFPYFILPYHFERELEIMQRELDKGNDVFILVCKNSFCQCEMTAYCDLSKEYCSLCISLKEKISSLLKSKKNKIVFIPVEQYKKENKIDLPEINSVKELLKFSYKNCEIGYGVGSSFSFKIDKSGFGAVKADIIDLLKSSIMLYDILEQILDEYKIDYGYIHNGRLAFSKIFVSALSSKKITYYIHEQGGRLNKFSLLKNASIHSFDSFRERVLSEWENSSIPDFKKKEIAADFYRRKKEGKQTTQVAFTKSQIKNSLPIEFYQFNKKIAIFNSSMFEYDYIGSQYTYKMYKSQYDGINRICSDLQKYPEIGIFIREHPHLANKENDQRRELRKINYSNAFLIPAESTISSYALLLNADIILTFNSTMGIEATYWGKPSICCSNAIYEKLNVSYFPNSHEEVMNLLLSESLLPIPKEDAEKIGYYYYHHGTKYKYYRPKSFIKGKYRGKYLFTPPKTSIKILILNFLYTIFMFFNKVLIKQTGNDLRDNCIFKGIKRILRLK